MKTKLLITFLFVLFGLFTFAQTVPNTTTFTLQNVVDAVNPTTDDLIDCFADAVSAYFNPAYSGSKNSLLNFQDYGPHNAGPTIIFLYSTGTGNWTIPSGVTSILVEIWGSGGAGGKGGTGTQGGGGGGGAYYLLATNAVTPGQNCTYTVGVGGTSTTGDGNDGTDTYFGFPSGDVMYARGGHGGKSFANGSAGGNEGGFSINFFDYDVYQCNGGSNGSSSISGGGSGGAGSTSDGNDASGVTGGSGVSEYGGAGGNGSSTSNTNGTSGGNYGAGGGGSTGTGTAGNGGSGLIRITY